MSNLDEVIECQFTRRELNILNNLIAAGSVRGAFKLDEYTIVSSVWEALGKYCPERPEKENAQALIVEDKLSELTLEEKNFPACTTSN